MKRRRRVDVEAVVVGVQDRTEALRPSERAATRADSRVSPWDLLQRTSSAAVARTPQTV